MTLKSETEFVSLEVDSVEEHDRLLVDYSLKMLAGDIKGGR